MQVSGDSFSIDSNNPPGALGVDTITMKGSDLPIYLSVTCLTSSCSDLRKKSASSKRMNLGFVKERKASKWLEGYASMLQPFNSKKVSLLAEAVEINHNRYIISIFYISVRKGQTVCCI